MKSITFRPLRRIQKTGKITVASYMQWRRVKTADYSEFTLVIDECYKEFDSAEYVHDHKGKLLFWYNHPNPQALPLRYANIDSVCKFLGVEKDYFEGEEWKLNQPLGEGFATSVQGFDCDGVPAI
jgi:hypothetical protein